MQQFKDGVVLRMCCGLTFTLFIRLFDKYYAPSLNLDLLFLEFLEGIPCIVFLHTCI